MRIEEATWAGKRVASEDWERPQLTAYKEMEFLGLQLNPANKKKELRSLYFPRGSSRWELSPADTLFQLPGTLSREPRPNPYVDGSLTKLRAENGGYFKQRSLW